MRITPIKEEEVFFKLRPAWTELLLAAGCSIFQSWEWSYSWWKHYGRGKRLTLLTLYDGKELLGIAPLYSSSYYLGLPLKKCAFLGTGPSDYGDFLVLPERKEEFFAALANYLNSGLDCDAVDFQQMDDDFGNLSCLEKSLETYPGLKSQKILQEKSVRLDLPTRYDELLASLTKKFAWNVSYYNRRLRRDYRFELRKVTAVDDVGHWMKTFFRLHQKRWLDKKVPTLLFSPKFQAFHRDVADLFSEKGWLGLYFLILDGEVVASLYGFKLGDRFYNYLGGFNPEWGRMSVSTVLTSQVIEECINDGLTVFDFLRGEEEYKFKWGGQSSQHCRLLVTPKGKKGDLIKRIVEQEQKVVSSAKQKLQKS